MTGWISRAGWGLAHVLRPDSTYQFQGEEYASTRCGRRVRADQVTAVGYEDRCKLCAKPPA